MKIPILMYHAVQPLAVGESRRGTVSLDVFTQQLQWLAEKGYESIDLDQTVAMLAGSSPGPRRPIVLTFDDGYRCVVEQALPVLREFGFSATLFVVTAAVGGSSDWYAAKGGQPLEHADWDELGRAMDAGCTIGSHTVGHAKLTELDADAVREELLHSREVIDERLGRSSRVGDGERPGCGGPSGGCRHLAYPFGMVDEQLQRLAGECGYRAACATENGSNRRGQAPLALRRLAISRGTDLVRLRKRLGWWL